MKDRRIEGSKDRRMEGVMMGQVIRTYRDALSRILFLDYDGTLVNFTGNPSEARIGSHTLHVLANLSSDEKNTLVIISGRDLAFLFSQFAGLRLNFIAEHGYLISEYGREPRIELAEELDWKERVINNFNDFITSNPGSFIEEKEASVAIHFRNLLPGTDPGPISLIRKKMKTLLSGYPGLEILYGNKVAEVKPATFNKGTAATSFMRRRKFDFILAAGDDVTDESLFRELPCDAFTFKVGESPTMARFRFRNPGDLIKLLEELGEAEK